MSLCRSIHAGGQALAHPHEVWCTARVSRGVVHCSCACQYSPGCFWVSSPSRAIKPRTSRILLSRSHIAIIPSQTAPLLLSLTTLNKVISISCSHHRACIFQPFVYPLSPNSYSRQHSEKVCIPSKGRVGQTAETRAGVLDGSVGTNKSGTSHLSLRGPREDGGQRLSTAYTSPGAPSAPNSSKARLRWETVKDLSCVNELDIASLQQSVAYLLHSGEGNCFT